jgi:hypothetical protein
MRPRSRWIRAGRDAGAKSTGRSGAASRVCARWRQRRPCGMSALTITVRSPSPGGKVNARIQTVLSVGHDTIPAEPTHFPGAAFRLGHRYRRRSPVRSPRPWPRRPLCWSAIARHAPASTAGEGDEAGRASPAARVASARRRPRAGRGPRSGPGAGPRCTGGMRGRGYPRAHGPAAVWHQYHWVTRTSLPEIIASPPIESAC